MSRAFVVFMWLHGIGCGYMVRVGLHGIGMEGWGGALVGDVGVFADGVEAGALFGGVEVVVSEDECVGVSAVEGGEQCGECCALCRGACVGWYVCGVCPAVGACVVEGGESADVADADGVCVVVEAVCSCHFFGSAWVDGAVECDDVVVADAVAESSLAVPEVYVPWCVVPSFGGGTAVYDDE